MNLNEFKAWFEGFSENLSGAPTQVQWDRIKAKIAEIKDAPPVSYPVYIDRYVRPWYDRWYSNYAASASAGALDDKAEQYRALLDRQSSTGTEQWNSADAFRAMGRSDFQSIC